MTVVRTDIPALKLLKRGKVRDVYDLGDQLLIVATDRISAFDVVMDDPIPEKGKILTALSVFWFQRIASWMPHHFLTCRLEQFPAVCQPFREVLQGRSMLVRKTAPLPVECVVRGYLVGSGWEEYRCSQTIAGISLPPDLQYGDPLPEPIFTPALKNEYGHDENISFDQLVDVVGRTLAEQLRELSLQLYRFGAEYLTQRSLILVDTKFEFGIDDQGTLRLIDEVLTPDSSRFWKQQEYDAGQREAFFDKQVLRNYLLSLKEWNRMAPPPRLPDSIVQETKRRYQEIFAMITGTPWTEQRFC